MSSSKMSIDMRDKEKLSNRMKRHDKHIKYMILDWGKAAIKSMILIAGEF